MPNKTASPATLRLYDPGVEVPIPTLPAITAPLAIPTPPATVNAPDVVLVETVVFIIDKLPIDPLLETVKLPPVNEIVANSGLYINLVLDVLSVEIVPLVALVKVIYLFALVVVSSVIVRAVPLPVLAVF